MIDLLIKIMAVYFLFVFIFGSRSAKIHSAIIFLSCFVVIFFPMAKATTQEAYIAKREIYTLYDGVTSLILVMFITKDKYAWKQALLLSFATLCHIMVILSLINQQAGFFYNWYSELIFLIGILQIMVSYDGFIHALSNLQVLLLRAYTYCNRTIQSLPTHKKSRNRS